MNYSFITMWYTMDGVYHSNTSDHADFDSAVGAFHAKFKPLQNDENVSSFVILLLDSTGKRLKIDEWKRTVQPTEAPVEEPVEPTE